jgi:hypothetical protein
MRLKEDILEDYNNVGDYNDKTQILEVLIDIRNILYKSEE